MGRNENIDGQPSPQCLCGRKGRFRFYEVNDGMLCFKHMQFWLEYRTLQLLGMIKKDDDKVLAMIYADGKKRK